MRQPRPANPEPSKAGLPKSAPDKPRGLRKLPTQARSRARVDAILKATGALLGEVGYDGLTTNLIAERADVPVGSIYQFFDGKDDIVAALVEQFQERLRALVSGQLDAASLKRDRTEFITALVDGIAGIQAEASAFVCVFSRSQSNDRFDGLARDLRHTLTHHLDRVVGEAFPRLPSAERSRMLAAWSAITGAMIANLDRSRPGERRKLLDELIVVLSAYLDAKLAAV
ncbi:TetR/AcrR family transcriptional regulator [Bradyrhizobium prioriisuperbiae]|uniref:TetR/AcrR family transcriptional regulator n=1 Tax=Bradyrhizobium prioriisuperbiae TaxID=2854389 RepID=UPI0028E68A4A|nr:TetR/AcrR family transcriptional regulator [Bradyrhizobium prioritasuperba]